MPETIGNCALTQKMKIVITLRICDRANEGVDETIGNYALEHQRPSGRSLVNKGLTETIRDDALAQE